MKIVLIPDLRFAKEGLDILSTIELSMTQAALGCSVSVETVYGDFVTIQVALGTNHGAQIVLRGKVR